MDDFGLPKDILDMVYEIKKDQNNLPLKIVSYFPLSDKHKMIIQKLFRHPISFHSIFSDVISYEDWEKSKEQIKKRFHDELFDIDSI